MGKNTESPMQKHKQLSKPDTAEGSVQGPYGTLIPEGSRSRGPRNPHVLDKRKKKSPLRRGERTR